MPEGSRCDGLEPTFIPAALTAAVGVLMLLMLPMLLLLSLFRGIDLTWG